MVDWTIRVAQQAARLARLHTFLFWSYRVSGYLGSSKVAREEILSIGTIQ